MHKTKSSHFIRFATSAAICATLALGTAGVAVAGQSSHHHGDDGGPTHDLTMNDAHGVITVLGTNSITLAGGESLDVILDASNTSLYPKGSVFYLFTPQLDHLSNDQENFGGLMTEVHIN